MNEEILIVGAVIVGVFLLMGRKSGAAPGTTKIIQTSPLSNNPNKGINSGASVTGITVPQVIDYTKQIIPIIWNANNNATNNPSFDDLDTTGQATGGWGNASDVEKMTLPVGDNPVASNDSGNELDAGQPSDSGDNMGDIQ